MRSNYNKEHYKTVFRKLKVGCTDMIGQHKRTFTVDENDNQNSPSFKSAYDFFKWMNEAYRYAFKVDYQNTPGNRI